MTDLSVIIVSYNTKEITKNCILLLSRSLSQNKGLRSEIIVVDNASADGTPKMLIDLQKTLQKKKTPLQLILNSENTGYSKANNKGVKAASGRFLLFLNSDVLIENLNFQELLSFLNKNRNTGVLTVRVNLPDGKIDPASHRGFPTLWRSFSYFSGLETLFGRVPLLNRLFGGYHLTFLNRNQTHEIDSPTGAFYLVKKSIFESVGGFDEKFFMYGEDLDLSYRIKQRGIGIVYFPKYSVTHLKYQSGIRHRDTKVKSRTKEYFYNAMRIFYDKHYAGKTPGFLNNLVYFLINYKKRGV